MPVCFQLYPKGSKEPARFSDVDNAMCKHFGVEPHETDYYLGWYDFVGLRLALGFTWAEIAQENEELVAHCATMDVEDQEAANWLGSWQRVDKRSEAIEWLRQNYTSDAWREIWRA